jgi:shikimate kinase
MALIREPLYRDVADLAVPGEHGSVATATERCIALIDHYWQRHPLASSQQTA